MRCEKYVRVGFRIEGQLLNLPVSPLAQSPGLAASPMAMNCSATVYCAQG